MNDQPGKRKILLVMPDYMDYTDLMYKGIRDFLGTEVSLVTTTGIESRFSYKSNSHRVQNFFLKNFFNRDDKKLHYLEIIRQKLQTVFDANPRFDDILILRPDLIEVHLAWIKEHTTCMIAYFWDSFSREPGGKKTIQYFDRYFSFEPRDVKKYDLHFLPNFFPNDLSPVKGENPVDLFFIASYDSRIGTLKRILRSLKTQGLHTNINIFRQDIPSKNASSPQINWRKEFITRSEVIRFMQESKVLLDIAQPGQKGLSFRIFEALGLGKKLITSNQGIRQYDFYDPNNIFIWSKNDPQPPSGFFTTPYTPPPSEILQKYSLQNWIHRVFKEGDPEL